jgi:hypothetical protein
MACGSTALSVFIVDLARSGVRVSCKRGYMFKNSKSGYCLCKTQVGTQLYQFERGLQLKGETNSCSVRQDMYADKGATPKGSTGS